VTHAAIDRKEPKAVNAISRCMRAQYKFFLYKSQNFVGNNVESPPIHADCRKLQAANSQLDTQSGSVAEKLANCSRLIASNRSLQACEIVDPKILAFVVLSLVSNKRARLD
jgi:hypothetical protein